MPIQGPWDQTWKTDIGVWRPGAPGVWYIYDSPLVGMTYGASGDIPMPADYDGDGLFDRSVWRASDKNWWIGRSSDANSSAINWPDYVTGDIPKAYDFDGDGRADMCFFRPSNKTWYIKTSSSAYYDTVEILMNGYVTGDQVCAGDFNGSGKLQFGHYRGSTGVLYYYEVIRDTFNLYSFGELLFDTKPFRVTKITPNTDFTFTIDAIEYNATVYDSDVGEPAVPTPDYSNLEKLPPVTNLTLSEIVLKLQDGTLSDNIDVQFVKPLNFNMVAAEIWYKAPSKAGYLFAGKTYSDQFRIQNLHLSAGSELYTVIVSTVNSVGQKLDLNLSPSKTIQMLGMFDPPSNVTLFYAIQSGNDIRMDWKHIEDADLLGYEIRMGNAWDTGLVIGSKIRDDYFYYRPELSGTYQFFIKAIDSTNHYSPSPTSVIVTVYDIGSKLNIVYDHDYVLTPASGTKVNFSYKFEKICNDNRIWTGTTSDIYNDDIYAACYNGDIYKSSGGTGAFTAIGAGSQTWCGMCSSPKNGDIYAVTDTQKVFIKTVGTGGFNLLAGTPAVAWYSCCAAPNGDIYAGVTAGDIYKRSAGTGSFVAQSAGTAIWGGMAAKSNGDIYAARYGGNLYKQTGGIGSFVSEGLTTRAFYGIGIDSLNNMFACVDGSGILKRSLDVGEFSLLQVPMATPWGLCVDKYDHVYITGIASYIYKFENNNLCGSDVSLQYKLTASSGSYETFEIDLLKSGNKTVRLIDDIDSSEDATDLTFPDRTDLSYPDDTDLHITGTYFKYPVYMFTASTGATKWWGAIWNPYYGPVDANGRYFKFREDFRIESNTAKLSLCGFRTIIDVPETSYKISNFSVSSTSGITVLFATYDLTFWATPSIGATVVGSSVPLVPYIYNKSTTGFTIKLLDIVGDACTGSVDITIFGY
jgi:hypothetical protein